MTRYAPAARTVVLLTLSHAWSVGVLLLACEQAIAEPSLLADPS